MAREQFTRLDAANELDDAYDEGRAVGLQGDKPPAAPDRGEWWHLTDVKWNAIKRRERHRGQVDGYAEFVRRVKRAVNEPDTNDWPPPPPTQGDN